ncbi:hypothetical protein BCR44DRAFT_1433376 [Catenaria anguillulae PL171]|uniref:Uncharacterized protein n=1 Tax=Catenaria anguillulae PL171 TaxID=765915 RepID=A0A1Y2HND5_9FUNG|nr:hypothetical protein BCR44DRAFT_1433376 [Catenaria anguillulae PL171]
MKKVEKWLSVGGGDDQGRDAARKNAAGDRTPSFALAPGGTSPTCADMRKIPRVWNGFGSWGCHIRSVVAGI